MTICGMYENSIGGILKFVWEMSASGSGSLRWQLTALPQCHLLQSVNL